MTSYHFCHTRRFWLLMLVCLVMSSDRGAMGDDCHVPTTDTGNEEGLAADICSINDALGKSPADFVTADAFYRLGFKSRQIFLKDIATGKSLSSSIVTSSVNLFGSKNWMNKLIQKALAGDDEFDEEVKRVQVIKKLLQGSVLGHRMFTNLASAFDAAVDGKTKPAIEHIERAMANFFGTKSECAIFGNGHAQGIEFEAMDRGVSIANYDLVEAFADAIAAIKAKPVDEESLMQAFDAIRENFLIIYLQAVVKYATRIADDNSDIKSQAEGYGYYHAIAGQVYSEDETAHETIIAAFDLSAKPDTEKAEKALEAALDLVDTFKINPNSFGAYNASAAIDYIPPANDEIPCEGHNPFIENVVNLVDSDR